mmetsp:Transcript_105662/g.264566  ORF Transcript_105662/g.264566 Transcript_105662/m.264566 type:complete len:228 (-) Transcript_105662:200-883(-)
MAAPMSAPVDIKGDVALRLEAEGALGQIRAQIRASVYRALLSGDGPGGGGPAPSGCLRSAPSHLVSIVADFLQRSELDHTRDVFLRESAEAPSSREELLQSFAGCLGSPVGGSASAGGGGSGSEQGSGSDRGATAAAAGTVTSASSDLGGGAGGSVLEQVLAVAKQKSRSTGVGNGTPVATSAAAAAAMATVGSEGQQPPLGNFGVSEVEKMQDEPAMTTRTRSEIN